jgi:hypothetical protein
MASDSIRVQYNRELQPLEELLSGVKRVGGCWVGGAVEIPMPKIEIAGVGVLSFPVLHAPDYENHIAAAAELLETNHFASGTPTKIAWLLEHQYSPDGLAFAALKSADAARAKLIA